MQPDAQKELFENAPPRTLFVTYTTTLIRASQQLLEPLLNDSMKHVDVNNLDKIVRKIVGQAGLEFRPATENHKLDALKDAIQHLQNNSPENPVLDRLLRRVSHDYLIAEFDWVIEGREIGNLENYLEEDRSGRGIPLDGKMREAVWTLHESYLKSLEKNERDTWNQLRSRALAAVLEGKVNYLKYDVVIVDEAQDLTPVALRLCMALCKEPQGFYMTADSGQSIYNRGFSWKRVDSAINVQGKTTILKYNYRSTRQIMEASLQSLKEYGGGDPETTDLVPVMEGPKPRLMACQGVEDQVDKTAQYLKNSADELRLPLSAGAVLVRSNKAGTEFAEALTDWGIPAELVKGDTFDLDQKVVKVMTIHSAKGLEFPFVAVARVDAGLIPLIWNVQDEEEKESRLADERRLLSVALSRAMRRLALLYNQKKPSLFIREFNQSLWNVKSI
jgi:superfamily I DNA/RNA helicase